MFTWNYYLAHPEFMTLLNSENLHRARHLKRSTQVPRDELAADRDAVARCWSAACAQGVFRRGVDPVQLYISIAALGYFYLVEQPHAVDDLRAQPDGAEGGPSGSPT